jgi:hypothetical protein
MSPALLLAAAWLIVIGYGLFYIGYMNQKGTKTSFADAFGISKFTQAGQQGAPTQSQNPIQNQGRSLVRA